MKGVSREQGERAWGFLRFQEGFKDPGSKGSKLGARGASWGLSEVPGRFQGPRDVLGAREASWGLSEVPGRFQRPRDGLGAREVSWGLPEAPGRFQ